MIFILSLKTLPILPFKAFKTLKGYKCIPEAISPRYGALRALKIDFKFISRPWKITSASISP
jgi:hypothetical protein